MDQLFSRFPFLETLLWILAGVAAFGAFLIVVPGFFNSPAPAPTPAQAAPARVTLTPLASPTAVQLAPPPPKLQTPSPLPTPAANARAFSFGINTHRSGWLVGEEKDPHWGDRNLHAGEYKGQTYHSLVSFDLSQLAPGSRILFARVELTGLNRGNLGASGTWSLRLLPAALMTNYAAHTSTDFIQAAAVDQIGSALSPTDLAEGQTNQFQFDAAQLGKLEQALNQTGQVAFRIDGPAGSEDNLFTWDGGDPDPAVGLHPTLKVIAIPAQFVPITNTPTPQNVLTAAAQYIQGTESAKRFGTPTLLPRAYATFVPLFAVTPQPTPANSATASAQAAYATAVALTTGTFTPTPSYWVTTTPTPVFLALGVFTPAPTQEIPTPTLEVSRLQQLMTPIPTEYGLNGNILFMTDREGLDAPQVWVMNPSGVALGKLSGDVYYRLAETRALFSPDKLFQVDVGTTDSGAWQIVVLDVAKGILSPLIKGKGQKGSYQPTWSPLGDKIAYVSDAEGTEEIYVYDLRTKISTRLTFTPLNQKTWERAQNNHPAWSPDGKQIIFASNRDPFPRWQIWIMDADGGNMRRLSTSPYNDTAPDWVK